MKTKKLYQTLAIVMALLIMGVTGAMAENPVVYNGWSPAGGAGAECSQIGTYACSYKIDEWDQDNGMNGEYFVNCTGPEGQDWSTTITVSNSGGYLFDWSSSPSAIGAVIVKAGTGANVWLYDPQVWSDTGLYGYQNKEISHATFCYHKRDFFIVQRKSPIRGCFSEMI